MLDLELLCVRDPICINGSDTDKLCSSFVARVACAVMASVSAVIVNTCEGIEVPEQAAIWHELSCPPSPSGRLTCCPGHRRSRSSTPRLRLPSVA